MNEITEFQRRILNNFTGTTAACRLCWMAFDAPLFGDMVAQVIAHWKYHHRGEKEVKHMTEPEQPDTETEPATEPDAEAEAEAA